MAVSTEQETVSFGCTVDVLLFMVTTCVIAHPPNYANDSGQGNGKESLITQRPHVVHQPPNEREGVRVVLST